MSLMAVRIHDSWAKLWRPVRWNRGWLMGVGFVGFLRFFLMKNTKTNNTKRTEHQKRRSSESSFPIGVDRLFFWSESYVFEMHSNLYMHAREISTFWCHFSVSHAEGRGSLKFASTICKSCSSMTCDLRAVQLKISANLWPGMYPFNVTTNPPPKIRPNEATIIVPPNKAWFSKGGGGE